MDDDGAQSGYYREIARAFLGRRGGPLLLSPKDQAAIAAWEADRVPLPVVLEGIGRAFEVLKTRGRATRSVSLAFCDRQVRAAFAQHRDRAAGGRKTAGTAARPDKRERARREISQALEALPAGDAGMNRLLQEALGALAVDPPDEAALERVDAGIEENLWAGATAADRAAAEAEARQASRGRKAAAVPADEVRRRAVMAARARRRIPHVSLHYY